MESPNLNFSIVNAVLFRRRTICCFQAKPHIFLYHGLDTPFLRPSLYLWHFPGTAAIGKTPEIRGGNRVWRIPPCSRSGTQSDPCISSVTPSIMITTSNSPVKGSGIPNQFLGVLQHTIAMSGWSRVRTELFQLLVIPSLAPHPVQTNGESPRYGDLGDLPSPPHRQVEKLAAPFRDAAHRDQTSAHARSPPSPRASSSPGSRDHGRTFRFLMVLQSPFLELPSLRIHKRNLLKARVVIQSYNHHIGSFSPEPSWLVQRHQVYSGLGSRHCHGINFTNNWIISVIACGC